MKPTDWQIGDYALAKPSMMLIKVAAVHHKKVGYHAVTHKLNWVRMDLLEPIPLTPEILKASGFEHSADDEDRYSFEDTTIIFKHDTKYLFSASVNGSKGMLYLCANYVHELQHALKICGLNDLADNLKLKE
jgi:hypothetical protein